MRTVTLKPAAADGSLLLAHPFAAPGPDGLIYAINNVPNDITSAQVCIQARRICFAHRFNDPAAYSYSWSELAGKPQGSIINRY